MKRLLRLFGVLTLLGMVTFILVTPASAATKTGRSVTLAATETTNGDLYIFGRTAKIAGVVNGDLFVFANDVIVTGTVNGSVLGAVNTLKISGTVQNSIRVIGKDLIISGHVGGDVLSATYTTTLTRGSEVAGHLIVTNGAVAIRGSVGGDVRGSADSVAIDGPVAGSVLVSGSVTVTRNGSIGGDLKYANNTEATVYSESAVVGTVQRSGSLRAFGVPDLWSAATSQLLRLLVGLMTGLILVLLIPGPIVATADIARKRLFGSAAMGLISIMTWPILAGILAIVVVGIPLAITGTVLMLFAAWFSQVFVGLGIGRMILPKRWKINTRGYNILALAIGMILLWVLRSVPLPYVSTIIALLTALVGIGALLLTMSAGANALRNQQPNRPVRHV